MTGLEARAQVRLLVPLPQHEREPVRRAPPVVREGAPPAQAAPEMPQALQQPTAQGWVG